MQSHSVHLVSKLDPIKFLFDKPSISMRLAKWSFFLAEFDITFVSRKSVKGRVMADQCADFPSTEQRGLEPQFPDDGIFAIEGTNKWQLFFDGASNKRGNGIGLLLVDPSDEHTPIAIKLNFSVTNNAAEYEACIAGLEAALERNIKSLEVFGDSALIINQVLNKWKTVDPGLQKYHAYMMELIEQFEEVTFEYLPRDRNRFADALATLASLVEIPAGKSIKPLRVGRRETPAFCFEVEVETESVDDPWYSQIYQYLKNGEASFKTEDGEYREGIKAKSLTALKRLASHYVLLGDMLYKKRYRGPLLRCISKQKAEELMDEVHGGTCGPHMNARALMQIILRMGYFWISMEADCIRYVRSCDKCQRYANINHLPPHELYCMTTPWPFATWGIDIIGKITPAGSNGHAFVLVAIDYFTKWVEAKSYKVLNSKKVAIFIKENIFCRYGLPGEIISDNGSHFDGECEELLAEFKITRHKSSPYRPMTNGAVEAANKTLENIIRKMAIRSRDWPAKLHLALWGYRTSVRTATGETPFALTYGMEAVLPAELEVPSLRVMLENHVHEIEWLQRRHDELALLDERRLKAIEHTRAYQNRMARSFNKKVKPRGIREGDLVVKVKPPTRDKPRGKWEPVWIGPYVVQKIFSGGAMQLADLDGNPFVHPVNGDKLRRYYA